MRKIILLLIMFTFLGCGETKIEKKPLTEEKTTKKESIKDTITFQQVTSNDRFIEIFKKNFKEDIENFKKNTNYENNFIIEKDDFNLEEKIEHSKVNKNDKIQIILYMTASQNDKPGDILAKDFSIRGEVIFNLTSNKYLSYDKITILTDNSRYSFDTPLFSRESDWNKEYVQTCKIPFDSDVVVMMMDIGHSKKVRIRFAKGDKHMDFNLSAREINNIKELMLYYVTVARVVISIHDYLDTL